MAKVLNNMVARHSEPNSLARGRVAGLPVPEPSYFISSDSGATAVYLYSCV
jgi:hypothetical protein